MAHSVTVWTSEMKWNFWEHHLEIRQQQELDKENTFQDINSSKNDLQDINKFYVLPGGCFWVSATDTVLMGFIGLTHKGELKRLCVKPEHRKQGHGTALVKTVTEFCDKHLIHARLSTGIDETARPLYERHGFSMVGFNKEHQDWVMQRAPKPLAAKTGL